MIINEPGLHIVVPPVDPVGNQMMSPHLFRIYNSVGDPIGNNVTKFALVVDCESGSVTAELTQMTDTNGNPLHPSDETATCDESGRPLQSVFKYRVNSIRIGQSETLS